MKKIILILLMNAMASANGAELFGVDLTSTTRDQLRLAVKNAGVKLVSEAGDDAFYDVYLGDSVLYNSSRLYLGFVKKDKKFAFAEYEFSGLKQPVMLQKLNKKYGRASLLKGKFISDQSYLWQSEGIKITLYQDWPAYKTRLIYFNPEALQQLRTERQQFGSRMRQQKANYLEQAY